MAFLQNFFSYISSSKTTVFHATYTGKNNEIALNFIHEGATSNLSGAVGTSQGKGFYVWTKKELAINHALNFLGENSKNGNLIILSFQIEFNPQDWDLDYEINAKEVIQVLYKNFDFFKNIGEIKLKEFFILTNECELYENPLRIRFNLRKYNGTRKMKTISGDDPSVGDGEYLGSIFNALQITHPKFTQKVEMELFPKVNAVKYVGKERLPVYNVEVYSNNSWRNLNLKNNTT